MPAIYNRKATNKKALYAAMINKMDQIKELVESWITYSRLPTKQTTDKKTLGLYIIKMPPLPLSSCSFYRAFVDEKL